MKPNKNNKSAFNKEMVLKSARSIDSHLVGKPVIYYLVQGDEVIYIGQTCNLAQRLLSHMSNKDFDRYSFFESAPEDLDLLEAELILHFKPALNKGVPSQPKYWSYDRIRRVYGLPKRPVQKLIGRECIEFNGILYVVMTDEKHVILERGELCK